MARSGVQVILTYPNNDAGGRAIIAELNSIDQRGIAGIQIHRSLGRHFYHGVLALAKDSAVRIACIGNSSSGIKETPAFGCPTVNIGSRQMGRLRGDNLIDVGYDDDEILAAALSCLNDEKFRELCRNSSNPYFLGDAGKKIAAVLAEVPLNQKLIRKEMTLQGIARDGWYC